MIMEQTRKHYYLGFVNYMKKIDFYSNGTATLFVDSSKNFINDFYIARVIDPNTY